MESLLKEYEQSLCHERNAKSQNNIQEVSSFSHELKKITSKVKPSIFSQHGVRLSNKGTTVSGYGLLQ